MYDANDMEYLIFEIAIKNIVLGIATKGGVSDANNKLIINIIPTVGSHIDPNRSPIHVGLNNHKFHELCILE